MGTTGIGGHRAESHCGVDPSNLNLVASAIQTFGGLSIGIQLPAAAQSMTGEWTAPEGWAETWTPAQPVPTPPQPTPTPAHHPWWWRWWHGAFGVTAERAQHLDSLPPLSGDWAPGSWGGHCVYALDISEQGVTCVSWGQLYLMDWGFWHAYVDEAHVVVDGEFVRAAGTDVSGYDLAQLEAWAQTLTPDSAKA